ncbi:cysteine and histidine-rich domain-containing protein 1a [Centroberyx gerrardi]
MSLLCYNKGCGQRFDPDNNPDDACTFHPGVPVFHDALKVGHMKYWSCCRKKTADFNSFLSQQGCTTGRHLWRKHNQVRQEAPCRFDWHQTGSQVIISIYAKNSLPELSYVEANSTTVKVCVVFEGDKEFEQKISLWGAMEVNSSVVNLMAAKMEVSLRKVGPVTWARLDLPSLPQEKDKEKPNRRSCLTPFLPPVSLLSPSYLCCAELPPVSLKQIRTGGTLMLSQIPVVHLTLSCG